MWGTLLFTRAGCIATATFDLPNWRPTPPHLASISQSQRVYTLQCRKPLDDIDTTTVSGLLPHGPAGFPSPASSASTACHQRRQPGGIPPHNGRAGKICRCDTPAQPHGDLGPKNRTPAPVTNASADEKNSLVVVRGVRRVSPQQILSRSI